MDGRVKAVKEEGVQLDNVFVQRQLAEDFILGSELITKLHTQKTNADLMKETVQAKCNKPLLSLPTMVQAISSRHT